MDDYTAPNSDSAALLTIDVQRDFSTRGAPAEIPGTADVIPNVQQVVEAFRRNGTPVVHVVRLYRGDGSNVDRCRRSAIESGETVVEPGSDGSQIVSDLLPEPGVRLDAGRLLNGEIQQLGDGEWAMYKPRWSAFYDSPLEEFLSDRSIDTVVVCGCNFPNCPRTTIYDGSQRDYRLGFIADATSQTYDRGVEDLAGIGVAVLDVDETEQWLEGNTPWENSQ